MCCWYDIDAMSKYLGIESSMMNFRNLDVVRYAVSWTVLDLHLAFVCCR